MLHYITNVAKTRLNDRVPKPKALSFCASGLGRCVASPLSSKPYDTYVEINPSM